MELNSKNTKFKEYDYEIHDNGGRPFLIKFLENEIIVYGLPKKNIITKKKR